MTHLFISSTLKDHTIGIRSCLSDYCTGHCLTAIILLRFDIHITDLESRAKDLQSNIHRGFSLRRFLILRPLLLLTCRGAEAVASPHAGGDAITTRRPISRIDQRRSAISADSGREDVLTCVGFNRKGA